MPPQSRKRDLITLDLAPNIDVNTLNNVLDDLCVGIATCNPVTVTDASNSKIKRDLITIDLDPSISVDLLNNLLDNLCVGIAVCNPVTVTQTTGSCSE